MLEAVEVAIQATESVKQSGPVVAALQTIDNAIPIVTAVTMFYALFKFKDQKVNSILICLALVTIMQATCAYIRDPLKALGIREAWFTVWVVLNFVMAVGIKRVHRSFNVPFDRMAKTIMQAYVVFIFIQSIKYWEMTFTSGVFVEGWYNAIIPAINISIVVLLIVNTIKKDVKLGVPV